MGKIFNYYERLLLNHIKGFIYLMSIWLVFNLAIVNYSIFFSGNNLFRWITFGSALLTLAVVIPSNIIYRRYLNRELKK